MLSDRCPVLSVCLSVCNVGVLWQNGWTDQDKTWRAGRPLPGHIVLDGDPAPPPKGGPFPQTEVNTNNPSQTNCTSWI